MNSNNTMLKAKITNIGATLSLFVSGIYIGKSDTPVALIFILSYIIFIWYAWSNIFLSQKLFIREEIQK